MQIHFCLVNVAPKKYMSTVEGGFLRTCNVFVLNFPLRMHLNVKIPQKKGKYLLIRSSLYFI